MPAAADPDLALKLAKTVADLYGQATADLLRLVAARLARGIDQPGWAERKLAETLRLRDEAQAVVDQLAVAGPEAAEVAVRAGWAAGQRAGAAEVSGALAPATHTRAVDALVRETVTSLEHAHTRILRSTVDAYRTVVAQSSATVLTGTSTRLQSTQRALNQFADKGVTGFVDRTGRRWAIDSYAEMSTRTAVGRAQVAGTLDRFEADGRDLVIVSNAAQECEVCRPWEGRVLSISGNTKGYPTVKQAQAAGLQHANCRHRLAAYVPGLTKPMRDTADPEGDKARQQQRYLERGVRTWKQRAAAALDDDTRKACDRKAREWQKRLREHVDTNDLQRRPERERLGAR